MAEAAVNAGSGLNVAVDAGTRDGVTSNVQLVRNEDALIRTYCATVTGAAGVAGIVATLTGNATSVVRLRRIMLSGTATTAAYFDVSHVKSSTAATGGTSTAPVVFPFDSNNAAASSAVALYTVAPTAGTSVGIVLARKILLTAATTTAQPTPIDVGFSVENEQPPVLRGATQQLALTFSAAPAGGSLDFTIWWTEETNAASF